MDIGRLKRFTYLAYDRETGRILMRGRAPLSALAAELETYADYGTIVIADLSTPRGIWHVDVQKAHAAAAEKRLPTWEEICVKDEAR